MPIKVPALTTLAVLMLVFATSANGDMQAPQPDPPTATFTVSPAKPVVGQDTVFDWTGDCPAGPCTFRWENEYADGPDGGNDVLWGTTDPLHVTFRVGETKYVHLAVTDSLGRVADGRQTVDVVDAPPLPSDTAPPTARLTAPTSGSTVSGTATLSATASDDVAVDHVSFRVDGQTVNSDSTTPYSYAWDSTTVADGSHSITALAVDAAGNSTSSSVANVTVNNTAPTGTWTHCADEDGRCSFIGTQQVRYGADTRWTDPRTFTDGVDCNNAVFGDPAVGTRKTCEWLNTAPPPPPPSGRGYPHLQMTKYVISSTADAQALGRFDWLVTDGENPTRIAAYWPTLRQTNPDLKITPIISGTENNNRQTTTQTCISPQQYDDPNVPASAEWTDSWWLKNYDGSYPNMPRSIGRHVANPTAFVPPNAAGERPNDHLAKWIKRCYVDLIHADGVLLDLTSDTSLYQQWPGWDLTVKAGSNVDLDRNGVRDVTEHGVDWVNQTWGAAMRDLVAKVRAKVGPDFIVDTNGGNGTGFAPWANGQTYEHGSSPSNGYINDNEIAMFGQWETNHFGYLWTAMLSQAGSSTAESNYRFMRHNLAAALVAGTWFSNACGSPCNYNSQPWYDEYSVDVNTGRATGDASRKGYLGQPTGSARKLANGVWRRDFDNGIVLLNNTSSAQTVNLSGTFRRIQGTQDPAVNGGQSVSTVTLPAQDGLILVR